MSSLADDLDHARLIEKLSPAMRAAGELIEAVKARGIVSRDKADRSPVTEADEAAERLLEAAIRALEPEAVIVGEEAVAAGAGPGPCDRFWLIDPLDGTRDFVAGGTDYSVNVGLVEDGVPIIGLVLHPPSGILWTGAPGLGAWKETAAGDRARIHARVLHLPPTVVTSRTNLDSRTRAWVSGLADATVLPSGSSLKLCLVAEGAADLYPRHGPTSEWDTAAADAILRAAGGIVLDTRGQPFAYGKPDYANGGFLALGEPAAVDRLPAFTD